MDGWEVMLGGGEEDTREGEEGFGEANRATCGELEQA